MSSVLIAYDGSGSTGNSAFYHDETQRILSRFPDANVLFWDTTHRIISREEMKEINLRRKGYGGTNTAAIANYVAETNFHGTLIVITDGQVSNVSVDACERELGRKWTFESVTAHLIYTGGTVNMSVTCPFTRCCPHTIYTYDAHGEQRKEVDVTRDDLALLGRLAEIETAAQFEAISASLESVVRAATMGTTGDPSLRDALLATKARIIAHEARARGASGPAVALAAAVSSGDTAAALTAARQLTADYYGGEDHGWSASLNRLVSMTEGALRSAFDLSAANAAIHSDRVRRAATASAADAAAVPLTEESSSATAATFECPLTLDAERDVALLVVAPDTPVLAGLEKAVVDACIDCPLNALNYPEVVERILAILDHPVSLRSLKEAESAGAPLTTSPLTRRPLLGALCLSPCAEHVQATTWTLARAIAGGKLVGNADLWYAVIVLLVHAGKPAHLAPIAPQLWEQMKWRAAHRTTFVGLTGLPELPTTRVALGAAIWYVLASPALERASPKQEALRAHIFHADALASLATHCGLAPLPAGAAEYATRLRAMLGLLSWVKKDAAGMKETLDALVRRAIRINPAAVSAAVAERETRVPLWVALDGPASPEQVVAVRATLSPALQAVTVDELVRLANRVDAGKSASDVVVPFTAAAVPPAPPIAWPAYGTSHGFPAASHIHISLKTCRPLTVCACTGKPWDECATIMYGAAPPNLLSLNEQWGRFVDKYGAFPKGDDFLVYLYNRYVVHGKKAALPACTTAFAAELASEYAEVVATLTPAQFVERWYASRKRTDRAALERGE